MDSVTYRQQLYPLGHGYPLWCPTPPQNLPPAYRDIGIRIGDVGLLTDDGGFDYLWNVHHPHSHPINLNLNGTSRVPPGDSPLPPLNENDFSDVRVQDSYHPRGACIAASTFNVRQLSAEMNLDPAIIGLLAGGGVAFELATTHDASAALALPLGARRMDALRLSRYQKYAAKHAVSWYQHVNIELERGALNGMLYLVTGTDKCSSWGATSVSRSGSNNALSVAFTASSVATAAVGFRNTWTRSLGASTRTGEEATTNQCVFTRGFVISIRELLARLPVKISGAVRTAHLNRGGADRPWVPGSGQPFSSSSHMPRSFEPPGGSSRENREDIEHAENESTFAESIMDEGDVEVVPFPSYRAEKSPAASIGEDLLRMYPDANAALVHDSDCMQLAAYAVKEGKGLLEMYCDPNQSEYKVQVRNGACMFDIDRNSWRASPAELGQSCFQLYESSLPNNKEWHDFLVLLFEEVLKTPGRGAQTSRFFLASVNLGKLEKFLSSQRSAFRSTASPSGSIFRDELEMLDDVVESHHIHFQHVGGIAHLEALIPLQRWQLEIMSRHNHPKSFAHIQAGLDVSLRLHAGYPGKKRDSASLQTWLLGIDKSDEESDEELEAA